MAEQLASPASLTLFCHGRWLPNSFLGRDDAFMDKVAKYHIHIIILLAAFSVAILWPRWWPVPGLWAPACEASPEEEDSRCTPLPLL